MRVRSRARAALRIHRIILRRAWDLENHRIVSQLEQAPSPQPLTALARLVPEDYVSAATTCLRQRCLTNNFTELLIGAGGHVAKPGAEIDMPVPARWRAHLRQCGLNVSRRSLVRFAVVVLDNLLTGIRQLVFILRAQQSGLLVQPPAPNYHVFVGANATNLPDADGRGERRNLAHWYQNYYKLRPDFPFIAENAAVAEPQKIGPFGVLATSFLPPLDTATYRQFRRTALRHTLRAVVATLVGHWWYAMLLNDIVLLEYFRVVPDSHLARRYVFHAGNCLIRPLWTYAAERRGSSVVNAFYSANFITFTPNKNLPAARTAALGIMSWPEMIVLDELSGKALVECGLDPATITVSAQPIDFQDNGVPLPTLTGPVLMLFDVTPFRPYWKAMRGFHNAYYTADLWVQFMDDVCTVAAGFGWTVALKAKRDRVIYNSPVYHRHLHLLEQSGDGLIILDAGIAASRAMAVADAVISMPFTSPSILAVQRGLPGAFYDPGGQLSHCAQIARGIPMLASRAELIAWFEDVERLRSDSGDKVRQASLAGSPL